MLDNFLVPIHRVGWPFIAIAVVVAVVLSAFAEPLGWLGAILAAWCVYFFRDPSRVTPIRPGLVVSPADGLVQAIGPAPPPVELAMGIAPLTRVSVFLSLFDVHVNRVPADGTVRGLAYRRGRFLSASLDKASELNECQAVRLLTAGGRDLAFVQIAGLLARRIRCDLKPGQEVRAGERFGLIRFGSRLDLYLPDGVAPLVCVGQRMIGGETVIADLDGRHEPLKGEIR